MKTQAQYAADPWYKQPWLLLAMIPLVAALISGTTFLTLSIISADGIVKNDHYRMARGYFSDTTKQEVAFEKNISATVSVDNVTGDLSVALRGDLDLYPEYLTLDFVSPTHQKYDLSVNLKQVINQPFYLGSLNAPLNGKRYLMISNETDDWRLTTQIDPPYNQSKYQLKAKKP